MSLTIFLHNKKPEVDIVRWFLGKEHPLAWAKAPIVTMSSADFRSQGYTWICRHFEEFQTIRLNDDEQSKNADLFGSKTVKQVMEDSDVVDISARNGTEWCLIPNVVRRNSFPSGMELLEKDKRRTIPANCGSDSFWQTFDEVFQFTHWYSI